MSIFEIAQTLQLYFAEQRLGFFIKDGKQYQVIGEATRNDRNDPADLNNIYIRSNNGNLVQLSNVITISEQSNPPQLYRYNRYVSATISAGLPAGTSSAKELKK